MDKQEMLGKLAREWDALLEIVCRVPEGTMDAPGVGGSWSVKDVLGHITVWEEETIKAGDAGRKGLDLPSYGDTDEWNERDVIKLQRGLQNSTRQMKMQNQRRKSKKQQSRKSNGRKSAKQARGEAAAAKYAKKLGGGGGRKRRTRGGRKARAAPY